MEQGGYQRKKIPYNSSQLIFDKGAKGTKERKNSLFNEW